MAPAEFPTPGSIPALQIKLPPCFREHSEWGFATAGVTQPRCVHAEPCRCSVDYWRTAHASASLKKSIQETQLWPNKREKSKKGVLIFPPSKHRVTHRHLPQITAWKRTGRADPEENCSRMANWAGEFISSAICWHLQGENGRGPAPFPAPGQKAGRRTLPSRQRSAACLAGMYNESEPFKGRPAAVFHTLELSEQHFSVSFQTKFRLSARKERKRLHKNKKAANWCGENSAWSASDYSDSSKRCQQLPAPQTIMLQVPKRHPVRVVFCC